MSKAWDREGAKPMPGDMTLYHYTDFLSKVSVYKLELNGHGIIGERTFTWGDDLNARSILDGVKEQWEWAQHAAARGEMVVALVFTWRGLRLLFPELPEEPMTPEMQQRQPPQPPV